ncbi:hypothetical protein BG844_17080 [Couchioplanes caeruleus subsp. caeruleus]|uniref:MmpS family membrane protein n=1 Tax=Couchioplanes caeruleus subsp. caeruleus TaxID=56427 RepID=A0A1K0GUQ1_9ACTN|nr:hypothetical protein BG844_17080 [Couchioplanes caeruleus subsp. caeruleus]
MPQYQPGYASLPEMPASAPPDGYPPTSQFPLVGQTQYQQPQTQHQQPEYAPPGGYGPPPGYGPPGYGAPPPPAPKRSNTPLVAVLVVVTLLLCAGGITSAVLLVNRATDKAKETIESLPTVPDLPTEAPELPTDLPTDLPELPTDLPTGIPQLPGQGKEIEVEYKVTGEGPVEIVYMAELGKEPKRVSNASLPWSKKVKLRGSSLVSVVVIRRGTSGGTISCSATIDGEEVAQKTSSGITASCSKVIF